MTHWHTQGSLSREHRADLDREAAREGRIAEAKAARATQPTPAQAPSTLTIGGHVRDWARARAAWVVSVAARRATSSR
jgi:hypothetical protein